MKLPEQLSPLRGLFSLSVLLCFVLTACAGEVKLTGPKTAHIEYTYETKGMGSTITGTKSTWYADYGRKQATHKKEKSVVKFFGISKTEEKETLSIIDGKYLYEIDLKAKTGMRMSMDGVKSFATAYVQETERQGKSMQQVMDEWITRYNGRWIEDQTVLGRNCKGLEIFGTRQWMYEQIPLRIEGTVLGVTTKELATKFEENPSVADSVFAVPAGIELQDAPDIASMVDGAEAGKALAGGESSDGMGGLGALLKQAQAASEQAEREQGASSGGDKSSEDEKSSPCGLSFSDFKALTSKVSVKGMGSVRHETEDGQHSSIWMKNILNQVSITGAGYGTRAQALEGLTSTTEGQVSMSTKQEYSRKGREFLYYELAAPGQTAGANCIMVFDAKRKMTLMITAQPARPKAELESYLEAMGY